MVKSLATLVILGLLSTTASAQESRASYGKGASQEQGIGLSSGFVLGGVIAGPPGAVVGGAIGALLGDGFHSKARVSELTVDLLDSRTALARKDDELEQMRQRVLLAEQQLSSEKQRSARLFNASLSNQPLGPCCDNTVLSLHFRSGSSSVEDHYREQLVSLARLARQMPSARLEVTGFADRTGESARNLSLSQARAQAVADLLEDSGVAAASISTRGFGDSKPLAAQQQFETDFFDRRVLVRLRDASDQYLTHSPDGE